MKATGFLKILAVLCLVFAVTCELFGPGVAAALTAGIMLYAWAGEYIGLLKDGAVPLDQLGEYERSKLSRAMAQLAEDVKRTSGADISNLKLHLVPADEINAFAYGLRSIAVTRGALRCCDDATLCAVLAHEVSHVFHMDALFSRVVFAGITLVILGLIGLSAVSVSMLWVIFAMLCLGGVCGGFFSVYLFRGIGGLIKGWFSFLQHGLLFIYRFVMAFLKRRCEYRADQYSCQLGYGPQLSYFLTRFVEGGEARQKSIADIIYATHPATYKRILRIEQGESG